MALRHFAETGSTNADMRAWIMESPPAREGDWVIADRQTAGRGRQGRSWNSTQGNFTGSTVLEVDGEADATGLALVVGLAVYDAVARWVPKHSLQLKWPNDVLADGGKLAGILLERVGHHIIVGIGVNLAVAPAVEGRLTASIGHWHTPCPTITEFQSALSAALTEWVTIWRGGHGGALHRIWLERAHPIGSALEVHAPDGQRWRGRFAGLAPDGALLLERQGGTMLTLYAGDVGALGNSARP